MRLKVPKKLLIILFLAMGYVSSQAQNCTVNAGINVTDQCSTEPMTLSGNSSGLISSSATWSQIGGPSVTIDNPLDMATSVTGYLPNNTYKFRVVATCQDGSVVYDDVEYTVLPITPAEAGDNIVGCPGAGNLAANAPGAGETGAWTIVGNNNAGVTITNTTLPNSQYTLPTDVAGVTTLRWTITAGNSCSSSDEITITNYGGEIPVSAGADQSLSNCYTTSQSTTLNASEGGLGFGGQQGTWSMVSGPNYPVFANVHAKNTTVSNLIEGTYVLRWEVVGSCASGSDEMTITVPPATQDVSNALAANMRFCSGATEAILKGSYPLYEGETVTWTQTHGPPGAVITNPNDPHTSVTGLDGSSSYNFTYTITNANTGCSTSDVARIRYSSSPTVNITTPDLVLPCNQMTATINYTVSGGTTTRYRIISGPYTSGWTHTNGGTVNMTFTESGTYTILFRRYANGFECEDAYDQINITVSEGPSGSNGGTNQILACNVVETTLAANTPVDGFGYWTQVSGPNTATLDDPYSPSAHVTGLVEGVYTFRWLISGGPFCSATFKDVDVVVSTPTVTASAAGTDQTVCYDSEVYLEANEVQAQEQGTWSVTPSAGVTIADIHNPVTSVTGLAPLTDYTFRWIIKNACSADTSEVIISTNNTQGPSIASAGDDQCLPDGTTTATMNGNVPAVGTGTWTVLDGPNTPTVTNPNANNSTITNMVNGTYTIEWAISNQGCQVTRDTIVVTIAPTPSLAEAGNDQEICGNAATLSAVEPVHGIGTWTLSSGYAGWTISDEHAHNAVISSLTSGTYVFKWTVGEGTCSETSDEVTIYVSNPPTTADAGNDITVCSATSTTLAANTPIVGNGYWSLVGSAPNVPNVADLGDPTTSVTGLVTGQYTFRWTIISGPFCQPSTDDVVVSVSAPAKAGPDQQLCNSSEVLLRGTKGTDGTWTEITNLGATITHNTSYTAIASNLVQEGNYTFRYTVPAIYGCPSTSDDVVIQTSPYGSDPDAGPDKDVCLAGGNSVTMSATNPTTGNGSWSLVSGPNNPTITDASSPTTTITGLVAGLYIFEWSVGYNWCSNYADIVRVQVYEAPTTALAGVDQPNACELDAQLEGNQPTIGIGVWSLTNSPGAGAGTIDINSPNQPTSTLSNPSTPGTYTLRWTITNGACPASIDEVDVTFAAPAPTVPNAGPDQGLCNQALAIMDGNAAVSGTGTWTKASGPAGETIVSPNSENTSITGLVPGVYKFVWTIVSGDCSLSDTVVVENSANITADASNSAVEFCEFTPVSLTANDPNPSTGIWSYVSGPSVPYIASPNDFQTSINGTVVGTYEFKWEIDNGHCGVSSDQVTIEVISQPDRTLDLKGDTVCEGGDDAVITIVSAENGVSYEAFLGTTSVGTNNGTGADLNITISNGSLSTGNNIVNVKATKGVCDPIILDKQTNVFVWPTPTVTLSVAPNPMPETGGVATITATLSNITCQDVGVTLAYTDGSATGGGTDYTVGGTVITIPAGSLTGTVTIASVSDTLIEGDETLEVEVTAVTNATENGVQEQTITIKDDDFEPEAQDDNVSTAEDTPINISVLADNGNGADDFGGNGPSTGTITIVSNPTNGTATVNDNGTPNDPTDDYIEYTPDANWFGTDEITYEICDSDGDCDQAKATVVVNPVNDAPEFALDTIRDTTEMGTPIQICPATSDIEGDVVDITSNFSGPDNGSVSGLNDNDNCFTYTPNPHWTGIDTLHITACDVHGACDTTVVIVTVGTNDTDGDGIIDAIDIDDDNDGIVDAEEGFEDTDGDGIPNYLDLDSDNDGILDIVESGNQTAINLDTNNDGVIDPSNSFGSNGLADAVEGGSDGAAPVDDPVDTDNDGIPNYLDLDSDNDGILDIVESGNQTAINLDTNNDGVIDLTNSFGNNGLADAVEGGSDGAAPVDDPVDTDNDGTPNYLDLDSDNDGISDIVESGNQTAINLDTNNDGVIDPANSFGNNGLADAVEGGSDGAAPVDDPIDTDNEGIPNYLDLDSDNDGCVDALEGGGNFTSSDLVAASGTLTVGAGSSANNENLGNAIDANGVPTAAMGGQSVGTSQDAESNACYIDAKDDFTQTPKDTPVSGNLLTNDTGTGLKVTEVNGVPVPASGSVTITLPEGTLLVNADGTYTFTPNNGYVGDVPTISYKIEGVSGEETTANLDITVLDDRNANGNNSPVANDDIMQTEADTPITFNIMNNDFDSDRNRELSVTDITLVTTPGGSPQTITIPASGSVTENVYDGNTLVGTITVSSNGDVTFTPEAGFTGDVPDIGYTLSDGQTGAGTTDTAVIRIEVLPDVANRVIANDDYGIARNTADEINIEVLDNDSDPEGNNMSITSLSLYNSSGDLQEIILPAGGFVDRPIYNSAGVLIGTLTLTPSGDLVFQGNANFKGTLAIPYTISDDNGSPATDKATIYLTQLDTGNTPLPIVLYSFEAKLGADNIVGLTWTSLVEIDNDYYTVYKSEDAAYWTLLDKVAGAGNSSDKHTYNTFDKDPYAPITYYKLTQTDYDGQVTDLGIRQVVSKLNKVFRLYAYPNPTDGRVNIVGLSSDKELVSIVNTIGQVVSCNYHYNASSHILEVDMSGLPKGLYVVKTTRGTLQIIKE